MISIPVQELLIHPTAQRKLKPPRLEYLRKYLDLDAVGVLHAVRYEIDGKRGIWVIDGQHRMIILIELGFGEWVVDVQVHLDVKDEVAASALFLKLDNMLPVNPNDKFDNAVRARFPYAVGVVRIATENNLKVHTSSADGNVCCVKVLEKVYNFDEGRTLAVTLETVIDAWGRTASAMEGRVIEGLGLLFRAFNGTIDRPALVKKLAKYPGGAPGLIGSAHTIRLRRKASIPRCLADLVVELYNEGRRSGKLDPI